jgi:hypothetical protein
MQGETSEPHFEFHSADDHPDSVDFITYENTRPLVTGRVIFDAQTCDGRLYQKLIGWYFALANKPI